MKLTLRFCSSLALALSLAFAARAQQNPAVPAPVPDPAAPAAAPAISAPTSAAAPAVAEPSTNAVAKPKAKKKTTAKAPAKKKAAAKKVVTTAAPANATAKNVSRNEIIPAETGIVKQDAVNVRGRPSFIGEVITKLKKGENVTLLEQITLAKPKKDEPAKWFKISLPTNTPVWVFAEFIDANKTVVPKKLNLRAGPGENFSPIGVMKKGETVKDLRKVNDWIEIEAPASAFAYVSANFIDRKGAAPTPEIAVAAPITPEPTAPVETAVVPPPDAAPKPPTDVVEAPKPAEVVTPPAPVAPEPAPVAVPQEIVVKRVVKREGTVKRAINIQAPTDYRLEGLDGKETINYLASPEEQHMDEKTKKMVSVPKFDLKPYIGKRVIITGEEAMDRRWALTPILTIETIELEQ
ncbi:MAG: hypothetical protein JWM68_3852 [Verrucomicrobiales bacterium]|nr:hypothetical protein [Verrucomicrobiales bacterium]